MKIVPVVTEATGELVGTANISPPDENGKVNASILIFNQPLLAKYPKTGLEDSTKGQIKILVDEEIKDE